MSEALKRGFELGDWQVAPLEGRLSGVGGERRLQPRVMDVLVCLASRPGEVFERDELVRAVWGERAVTDEPLTRAIADLRQQLGDRRDRPRYIETIPKRGYRLVAPVHLSQPAQRELVEKAAPSRPRLLQAAATGALAAIAAMLFVFWLRDDAPVVTPPPGNPPAIAVLPFQNFGGGSDDEDFADGLTETLTHVLAQLDGLKVIARTSAFTFKNRAEDVRTIGEQLGVDALLEGSVQRQGDAMRITTQLVSTTDGTQYWTRIFDRTPEEVFAVQDEIAAAVAGALQVALLDEQRAGATRAAYATRSVPAYDAYLQGRRNLARRTSSSIAAAIDHFRRAVALDPRYSLAWAGLADAHLLLAYYANVARDDAIAAAQQAIDRALAIDPQLGAAYASTGLMHWQLGETKPAETALQRAIVLDPNYSQAYFWLGTVYNDRGEPARALAMHRAALDLDPLAPAINNAIAVSYEKLGRFDDADEQFRRVMALDPGYAATLDRAARLEWSALAAIGDAVRLQRQAIKTDPGYPVSAGLLAEMYLDLGDIATAEQWVERAQSIGPATVWPHRAMALLLAYGDEHADRRLVLAEKWANTNDSESIEILLRIARDAWLELRRPAEAIALYRRVLSDFSGHDGDFDRRYTNAGADLAHALRVAGREAEASELAARVSAAIETLPRLGCCGFGIADVKVLVLRGDVEAAIERLEAAIAEGWRQHWWWETAKNPALAALHSDPRFRALMDTLERQMSRERAALAAE